MNKYFGASLIPGNINLKNICNIIFTLCLGLFCIGANLCIPTSYVWAHSTSTGEEPGIENYLNILEKLGHLNIDSQSATRSMQARANINHFPFFNIGGKSVYIDNAFWDLADELSRLYVREIKANCNDCQMPSVEEIRREAQSLVAKGWLTTKATAIKDAVAYRYAGEFIGLGAKYGTASGIAKVAGELVEDAMLVVFKMPGAHFLCEAITFVIAYYSGAALTTARSLFYSKYFNQGRLSTLVRLGVTSHYTRRALKRLTVDVPDFRINEELLQEFKEEHKDRKLTYRISGRHRVESFLKKLERDIANKRHRIERLQQSLQQNPDQLSRRQQQTLIKAEQEGIETSLKIKKKVFDGYRSKRFLLLKKKNSSQSLGQFAQDSRHLFRGTEFWFFELKNEIFEPNVHLEAARGRQVEQNATRALREITQNSITRHQLQQFENERSKEVAAHIFQTLDFIGDKNQKTSQRYLNVQFFEAFYGQVLPRLLGEVVEHSIEDLDKSERRFRDVSKLQWKAGRLAYFTNIFVDFVRFSAFDTKNADPTMRYHIRDYALQVLKAHADFAQFEDIKTAEDIRRASDHLNQKITELNSSRFWVEKPHKPRLLPDFLGVIPGLRGVALCEAIYM